MASQALCGAPTGRGASLGRHLVGRGADRNLDHRRCGPNSRLAGAWDLETVPRTTPVAGGRSEEEGARQIAAHTRTGPQGRPRAAPKPQSTQWPHQDGPALSAAGRAERQHPARRRVRSKQRGPSARLGRRGCLLRGCQEAGGRLLVHLRQRRRVLGLCPCSRGSHPPSPKPAGGGGGGAAARCRTTGVCVATPGQVATLSPSHACTSLAGSRGRAHATDRLPAGCSAPHLTRFGQPREALGGIGSTPRDCARGSQPAAALGVPALQPASDHSQVSAAPRARHTALLAAARSRPAPASIARQRHN
jgi:hypothetical protein